MSSLPPDSILRALQSPRWTGLVRVGLDAAGVAAWDPGLIRQPRVLVPIDVQALYVGPQSRERFVRLPFALTRPDGDAPEKMPEPFAEGEARPAGVHLHWAPPDALLRGELSDTASGTPNRLALPALPDRWIVLRIIAPAGASTPHVRGWVLEADAARAVPLAQWPNDAATVKPEGRAIQPDELTGAAGGTLAWAGVYDAVHNRLSFHDPLDDIKQIAPRGVSANAAAYVVAGWWSDPELDPLDGAQTSASLHDRLDELGWHLVDDAEGGHMLMMQSDVDAAMRSSVGLMTSQRYDAPQETTKAQTRAGGGVVLKQLAENTIAYEPARSVFADQVSSVVGTKPKWPRMALLHGVVHGVPVRDGVKADQRPDPRQVNGAFGRHLHDLVSTLAAPGLGATDADARRALERMLVAFTGQLLPSLGSDDGAVDIDEHEHAAAFEALPGGQAGVDRLLPGAESGPLPGGRGARSVAAKEAKTKDKGGKGVRLLFSENRQTGTSSGGKRMSRRKLNERREAKAAGAPEARVVKRPAPRYYRPTEPVIALRGVKRSLRHGRDGRFSADGRLHCRWPSQVAQEIEGVVDGASLIRSLGNAAIPDEVLRLARNALITDPHLGKWLAAAAAPRRGLEAEVTGARLAAEAMLRFGLEGTYDGSGATLLKKQDTRAPSVQIDAGMQAIVGAQITDELRRFSLIAGVDASPVGVNGWSQPWVPLWLEWEVALQGGDRLDGWKLDTVDLRRDDDAAADASPFLFAGRSALNTGPGVALAAAIDAWRKAEDALDADNRGEADEDTEAALSRVADAVEDPDLLSASLEGLHARLLGLPVSAFGVVHTRQADGSIAPPVPVDVPRLLAEGRLELQRLRVIDAFGRTLDVPVDAVRVPARDEIDGAPTVLRLRPRLLRPARWMFRLVDPADRSTSSPDANIDQVTPASMVNPVAGFLLPDHIDEALEFFDTTGGALGQLMHEPFGGGVTWEIAPGRSGPADAGPLYDLPAAQQLLGLIASGCVSVDAATRGGLPIGGGQESALSAMLRAIDTTLWTIDTFSALGTEHIAGLVGRPIAVVRALLRLDIDDDLDELDLSDADRRALREAAYAELADRAFAVRLGELTRRDDGLLGFFVDDDYARLHVVDRVVRDGALDSGRGRGHFGSYGTTPQLPDIRPIDHPYIHAEDELYVHPGQVLRLTLLMHPAGRVHLTSGVLPRKSLALARDWTQPGLSVIAPSVRVGPVLIDPGEVRLPKVSVFPKDQLWTRRTSPDTWRDDPIVAATQSALLPELPHEVQEGYIRVSPVQKEGLDDA